MKIASWLLTAVLWITGVIALVFFGWCLKGYCTKKDIKYAPVDKAEDAVLRGVDTMFTKKG